VRAVFVAWIVSAVIMTLVALVLGMIIHRGPLGILIDQRGRYSLTHFQLVFWSLIIISLISGVFFARVFAGARATALDFTCRTTYSLLWASA
jgi:hypothetical protein